MCLAIGLWLWSRYGTGLSGRADTRAVDFVALGVKAAARRLRSSLWHTVICFDVGGGEARKRQRRIPELPNRVFSLRPHMGIYGVSLVALKARMCVTWLRVAITRVAIST